MLNILGSQDAVKTNSPRGPRPFDQFLAFQPVQRPTNNFAFVTDESCDVVGTGKTCYVAIHEGEYIPVTEQRDSHAVNTTLDGRFQRPFALDDNFDITQSGCSS
jgi:hypothetical protein